MSNPNATPSGSKSKKRSKQATTTHVSKVKKITEKQRIEALERGANEFEATADLKLFSDLPLSEATKRGLKKGFFVNMTDIQRKSLPISLKGKDVLGAARTGSGKTLAFLVPVLEVLYRKKWGPSDGLGALIISPTRELAVQIFDVLRSIGGNHTFSAGLVIGGKNLKDERERLARMNILVATPGRLLQHMDQTIGFDSDNLQVLVLDEADRILDMGFSKTLAALLAHLPKSRQTLLFSATQTQSVSDLARLSLKDPIYVGDQEVGAPEQAIPQNLQQHYVTCELDKKLDILWSFIKTHLHSKTIVFMSSCKQVRFVFETFCRMHPGIPLLHLHGKQKQSARLTMYTKFTTSSHAVLFATDIAARGLDFPSIDWVLQVDAPEDADTYVHRVGRTARYESKGSALLFLLPSEEEGMKAALAKKSIQIERIKIRPSKTQSIENHLQRLAFQDPEIKYLGQRAFVSYLRSIYLHKDKSVFKLDQLPVERFAESIGLPGVPKIKFLNKEIAKLKKNASRTAAAAQAEAEAESEGEGEGEEGGDEREGEGDESGDEALSSSDEEQDEAPAVDVSPVSKPEKEKVRTKYDRMFERKNQNVLSQHYAKLIEQEDGGDADADDFITLKRADHDLGDGFVLDPADVSKRKMKMTKVKRALAERGLGKKLVFDEEGNPHELYEMKDVEELYQAKGGVEGVKEEGKKFAEGERSKMKVADVVDKEEARDKKREKKRKRKEKAQQAQFEGPVIAPLEEDDGYVSPDFDLPDLSDESGSEDELHPPKRSKTIKVADSEPSRTHRSAIEDEEELALSLLRRSR